MTLHEGLIIKAQSGFYTVDSRQGEIVCQLRGRLKRTRTDTTLAAVGDRVLFDLSPDGTGVIEEVKERERTLSRLAPPPGGRGSRRWDRDGYLSEREQVIVANPDQAVVVISCAEPKPRLRLLDRLLVGAELQHLPAVICANKIDLVGRREPRRLFRIYEDVGYRVIYTSAVTGKGMSRLRRQLRNRMSALIGPSGVGKSSLLNAVQPGLGLEVREVSQATSKGRHTTNVVQLHRLDRGGWVADTPGIRALALFDVDPEEIDAHFPDIAPFVSECRFSDCTHSFEPDCAVMAAVEEGRVHQHRYESYVRLRDEHQKLADMYWWGIAE